MWMNYKQSPASFLAARSCLARRCGFLRLIGGASRNSCFMDSSERSLLFSQLVMYAPFEVLLTVDQVT